MHLGQDNGFYIQTVEETYGTPIEFKFMSEKKLEEIIKRGTKIYRELNPSDSGFLSNFGGLISIAAMAAAMYFTAGAAAPAVAGAGASGGAAAASSAGASAAGSIGSVAAQTAGAVAAGSGGTAAGSVAGAWSAIKAGAGYAAKAIPLIGAATGDKKSAKKAKGVIDAVKGSEDFTDAATSVAEYLAYQHGAEVETDQARAALRERVRREQARIAREMEAKYVQQLRKRQGQQYQTVGTAGFNPLILALPIGAYFLMSN